MKVAVVGASGAMGREVTRRLRSRGHDVVEASRSSGVDAYTGAGLMAAFAGADAAVDCLNTTTASKSRAVDFFTTTARRISRAATGAGVPHLVLLSICNVADPVVRGGLGYYAAKAAQEDAYAASGRPVSVVATTQWFTLVEQMLARARIGPLALVPSLLVQPVHPGAVADLLVEIVEAGAAAPARVELAGPERLRADDMARQLATVTGRGIHVVAVPYPGRRFRNGALVPHAARIDERRYAEWLAGL